MKRSDAQVIVSQAQEELKKQGKDPWNISLLSMLTGISRPTLRKYKTEGFIHTHGNKGRRRPSKLQGFQKLIDELLSKGVSNSDVVFSKARKAGYRGGLTTIKVYIAKNKHLCPNTVRTYKVEKGNRGRRYQLGAGDCFQMDWGFVNTIDSQGHLQKLACFVMVCGHCGKRYVEFFTNARQENLFIGMIHGFAYLGGIPERVMTDNMKSVCISRSGATINWNEKYRDFMLLLGFSTTLNKPYHAFTKGRVERLVRYVKDNLVPGIEYAHLGDLNQQALQWCNEKNGLEHRGLHCIPNERHAGESFSALPAEKVLFPYLAPERSISFDGMVNYEGHRYGIPITYQRKTLRIQREGGFVTLHSHEGEVLSSFALDWVTREYYCENQWDLPSEQPEEQPSQPPRPVVMRQCNPLHASLAGDDIDLSIYDRIVSQMGGEQNA